MERALKKIEWLTPETVERARCVGGVWTPDPVGSGWLVWGGGTFGAGRTRDDAIVSWRESLESGLMAHDFPSEEADRMESPTPDDVLAEHEIKFLLGAGWTRESKDVWLEPVSVGSQRRLNRGHAVNSEKLHGLARGTHDAVARGELAQVEVTYLLQSGWKPADEEVHRRGSWLEPPGRHRRQRTLPGHKALSSQKWWALSSRRLSHGHDQA